MDLHHPRPDEDSESGTKRKKVFVFLKIQLCKREEEGSRLEKVGEGQTCYWITANKKRNVSLLIKKII